MMEDVSENTKPERERKFVCDFEGCNKTYLTSYQLKAHKMVHSGTTRFSCEWPDCKKSFFYAKDLRRHEASHTKKILKRNIRTKNTHTNKTNQCEYCSKLYKRSSDLETHKILRHKILIKGSIFKCILGDCGREFERYDDIAIHLKDHGLKPKLQKNYCQCEECGEHFVSTIFLNLHMKREHVPKSGNQVSDSVEPQSQPTKDGATSTSRSQVTGLFECVIIDDSSSEPKEEEENVNLTETNHGSTSKSSSRDSSSNRDETSRHSKEDRNENLTENNDSNNDVTSRMNSCDRPQSFKMLRNLLEEDRKVARIPQKLEKIISYLKKRSMKK